MFTTDRDRDLAGTVKLLIARLEAGHGADRALGADIIDALQAPPTMGDPTISVDCVLHVAEFLGQSSVRALWKTQQKHPRATPHEIARLMCATVLIIHLAKIERAPA